MERMKTGTMMEKMKMRCVNEVAFFQPSKIRLHQIFVTNCYGAYLRSITMDALEVRRGCASFWRTQITISLTLY